MRTIHIMRHLFSLFVINIVWLVFTCAAPLRLVSNVQSNDKDDSTANDPIAVMLFLFFGLCLGIFVLQIISRIKTDIPYTVVIFVIGVVCSSLSNTRQGGVLSQSITDWVSIDPDLIQCWS
jgi:di/tricarboxylate transporter